MAGRKVSTGAGVGLDYVSYTEHLLPENRAAIKNDDEDVAEIVLLAQDVDGYAGVLAMSMFIEDHTSKKFGYIHMVCSHKKAGKRLKAAAEEIAQQAGATYMQLSSLGTIQAKSKKDCTDKTRTAVWPYTNGLHDVYRNQGYTFKTSCDQTPEPAAPIGDYDSGYIMTKCF